MTKSKPTIVKITKTMNLLDLSSLTHLAWDSHIWGLSHALMPTVEISRIGQHCSHVLFSSSFCVFSLLRLEISLLLQTKVTTNCYHQMRFPCSNAFAYTAGEAYSAPPDLLAGSEGPLHGGKGIGWEGRGRREGEWEKGKGRGISRIPVLPTWELWSSGLVTFVN